MSYANLRREGRECALQLLFQIDVVPADDLDACFERFWLQQKQLRRDDRANGRISSYMFRNAAEGEAPIEEVPERLRAFSERLVRGVRERIGEIDARLEPYLRNWSLARLGGIERNVLRLAVYELFHEDDVPPIVCINEAIDLAKFFSSSESGRFVNGVLDRIRLEVERDPRRMTKGSKRGSSRGRETVK